MELEEKLKNMTEEKQRLDRENKGLKIGMETVGDKVPDEWDYNLEDETNNVARQLKQMKNRNNSLKKENELIRRELASYKEQRHTSKIFI